MSQGMPKGYETGWLDVVRPLELGDSGFHHSVFFHGAHIFSHFTATVGSCL